MSFLADIEYVDHGPELNSSLTQAPIICLHGIGGDHNSFKPQWKALSDTHRVLAWNMPGYRDSTPLTQLDFGSLSARFIQWIDALGIDQFHILGQSIGGMLAQTVALLYPHRVQSMILVATTTAFGGRDDSFKEKFLEARMAPLDKGESMTDLASRFVPEIVGSSAPSAAVDAAITSMAAVPEATYRQIMACLVTFNLRGQWTTLDCPVCLIAGSQDTNAPARTMEKMAAAFNTPRVDVSGQTRNQMTSEAAKKTCDYHCIDNAGHLVNLEQADACNIIIRHFLSKLST